MDRGGAGSGGSYTAGGVISRSRAHPSCNNSLPQCQRNQTWFNIYYQMPLLRAPWGCPDTNIDLPVSNEVC